MGEENPACTTFFIFQIKITGSELPKLIQDSETHFDG